MTSALEALSASSVSRLTPASTDPAPPGDVEVSVPVTTPMGSIYAIDRPPVNARARATAASRGRALGPGRGASGRSTPRRERDQWKVSGALAVECGPLEDGTKPSFTRVLNGRCRWRPPADRGTLRVMMAALLTRCETRLRPPPAALTRPASYTWTRRIAVLRDTLRLTIRTGHPVTAMTVFWLIWAPFWATIVVGIRSFFAHRLPKAASAECGPVGSFSVKLDTGTSGIAAKVVVVIPFLMSVLPTRITRTPLPSSTRSRSGNAAPPCETR